MERAWEQMQDRSYKYSRIIILILDIAKEWIQSLHFWSVEDLVVNSHFSFSKKWHKSSFHATIIRICRIWWFTLEFSTKYLHLLILKSTYIWRRSQLKWKALMQWWFLLYFSGLFVSSAMTMFISKLQKSYGISFLLME